MKTYIHAQGFEIWQSIVDGYIVQAVLATNDKAVKLNQNNSKATNSLLNGLGETIFTKVAHCKYSKQQSFKLYRGQFKQLKMKEDDNISSYFLRVNETVNEIMGLGEEIKELVIFQKVLISIPMRFDPKISTLEERVDLNSISMGELHRIFTSY
jgi:hypothetical protein